MPPSQAARSRLARWVLLAVEVTVFHARGLIDDPTTRKYLEGPAGLLLPGEWERLQPKERHTTCFYWISMQLKLLAAHGYISARELTHLHAALTNFRKESNDVMHRMEGDLPYPCASHCPDCLHAPQRAGRFALGRCTDRPRGVKSSS